MHTLELAAKGHLTDVLTVRSTAKSVIDEHLKMFEYNKASKMTSLIALSNEHPDLWGLHPDKFQHPVTEHQAVLAKLRTFDTATWTVFNLLENVKLLMSHIADMELSDQKLDSARQQFRTCLRTSKATERRAQMEKVSAERIAHNPWQCNGCPKRFFQLIRDLKISSDGAKFDPGLGYSPSVDFSVKPSADDFHNFLWWRGTDADFSGRGCYSKRMEALQNEREGMVCCWLRLSEYREIWHCAGLCEES